MFPVARGANGTAAEAADRRVERGRAGLESGIGVREAGVAGVVPVEAVGLRLLDETADLPRRGDADRVRENDLVDSPPAEVVDEAGDDGRVDAALEGAAECDADRHRRLRRPRSGDPRSALRRLVQRGVRVPLVEALRRAERHVDAVEPGRLEAFEAFLVQHQTRELDAVAALDLADDVLRGGHLRDRVVAHEAHYFDPLQARGREAVDELSAGLGRQDVVLVLEPVARPDLADRDQATRSGVTRTITRRSPGLWLWNLGFPVYFFDSLSMWRFASSPSSSSTVPVTVTYSYGSSCE